MTIKEYIDILLDQGLSEEEIFKKIEAFKANGNVVPEAEENVETEKVDFPKSSAAGAGVLRVNEPAPFTEDQQALMSQELSIPEDTGLPSVDTSLDSPNLAPRFIQFKSKGDRPGAVVYEDTYLETKAGQPGYPDTFDEYAAAFNTTPQNSSTEEIAIKATSNEKVFENLTNAAQGISYNRNTGNFDSDSSNTGLFKQEEEVSKKTFNKIFTGSGIDFEETDITQEGDGSGVLGSEALRARIKNPETGEYIYSEILELESDGSFKNNDKIQKFLDENKSYLDLPGWTRSKNKMIAKYKQWKNNELDPMLKKEILKADQAYIINPDLFKLYDKKINVGGYNTGTTVTETIHPYQKEIAQEVNRLKRKGLKGDLEAIAKINVRQNLKQADINEAIREIRAKFINAASNAEEAQAFLYASETFVKKEEAKAYNKNNEGAQIAAEAINEAIKKQQTVIDAFSATPGKNQSVDDFIIQQKNKLQPIIEKFAIKISENPKEKINSPKLNMLLGLDEEVMLPKRFVDIMTSLENVKNSNISVYNDKNIKMTESIGKISDIDIAMEATAKNYELAEKYAISAGLGFQDIVVNTGMLGLNILSLGQSEKVAQLGSDYVEYTREIRDSYQRDVSFDEAFSTPGNTGKFVMQEIANQLPIFLAMAASGGAAAYVVGASSAGGKMMDMQNEIATGTAEYSPLKLWGTSLGYGVAEGFFAQLTTVPILRRAKLNWMNGGKESVVNNSMKEYAKNQYTGLIYEPILESAGEAATVGSQNLMDGNPFMQGMDHASTSGLAFGFAFAAIPFLKGMYNSQFSTYETRGEIRTMQKELDGLQRELNVSLLNTPTTGINFFKGKQDLLKRSIEEKSIQLADKIKQQEVIVNNNLTEGSKNKVVNIINKQARLERQAIEIQENPNISNKERVKLIAEIKADYDFTVKQRNEAVKDETMLKNGTEWAAFKGLNRSKSQEYLDTADAMLSGERNGKQASKEDINDRAYDLYFGDKVRIENKKQGKSNSSLFKNFKSFDTVDEAITEINNDDTIAPENKKDYIQRLKQGNDGYWNPASDTMVAIVENQVKNQRKYTKTHEVGHKAFEMLLGNPANNAAFKGISDQILSTLKATDKKTYDKFIKDGIDDDAGNIDPTEVISRFMEYVAEDKITNVQKAKGISGLFGVMIQKTFGSDYKFDFRGEQDIFNFVVGFGKKLKDGTLTTADIKKAKESKVIKDLPTSDISSEANNKVSFSKSVTDLQTELDNLDESDFDFDPDRFENAKDNLKFKIKAAKKKEADKLKEKDKTKTKTDSKKNKKPLGDQFDEMVPKGTTKKVYAETIAENVVERIKKGMLDPLIVQIAAGYGIVKLDNIYGKNLDDFIKDVISVQFIKNIMNYDPLAANKSLGGYIIAGPYGIRNRVKEALIKGKKEAATGSGVGLDKAKNVTSREELGTQEAEKSKYVPLTKSNIVPSFTIKAITEKLTIIVSKLKSKITDAAGKNNSSPPLIREMKNEIGKVVGDAGAIPKLVIARLGNLKDGSYESNLIKHKKAIIENMTTTFLMGKDNGKVVKGGIPIAIEKSVGGAFRLNKDGSRVKVTVDVGGKDVVQDIFDPKFIPYPEWIGQEIDREKTLVRGATAGNEIVRRVSADEVSDDAFVGLFINEKGKLISGRREAIGKAIGEEIAFEIFSKEIQNENSDISKAFEANQEALKAALADNFVNVLLKDIERGTVKFSKTYITGIDVIDSKVRNLIKYISVNNINPTNIITEGDEVTKDIIKDLEKSYLEFIGKINDKKYLKGKNLTNRQENRLEKWKKSSGLSFTDYINNVVDYNFNYVESILGVQHKSSNLKAPGAKQAGKKTISNYYSHLVDSGIPNPQEVFLRTLRGWSVSGLKSSIFGNNKNLQEFITKNKVLKNAFAGYTLEKSEKFDGLTIKTASGKKAVNPILIQEVKEDLSKTVDSGTNKVDLDGRKKLADQSFEDLKRFSEFLKNGNAGSNLGKAVILNTMSSSMRSILKTVSEVKGVMAIDGLPAFNKENKSNYTLEHGTPVKQLRDSIAYFISDENLSYENSVGKVIETSYTYIVPTDVSKAIDANYKDGFPSQDRVYMEEPFEARFNAEATQKLLKAKGYNQTFEDITQLDNKTVIVPKQIKFSKSNLSKITEKEFSSLSKQENIYYHGTSAIVNQEFINKETVKDFPKGASSFSVEMQGLGKHYTKSLENAKSFIDHRNRDDNTGTVGAAYIAIVNPKQFKSYQALLKDIKNTVKNKNLSIAERNKTYLDTLKSNGFDSIIYKEGPSYNPNKKNLMAKAVIPFDSSKKLIGTADYNQRNEGMVKGSAVVNQPAELSQVDLNKIGLESDSNHESLLRIQFSKSARKKYENVLRNKRPELKDIPAQVDELFKWADGLKVADNKKSKYKKLALYYTANGYTIFPEDGYKIEEAIRLSEANKVDPYAYKNPDELINKFTKEEKTKRINPDTVKEFSNKRSLPEGVTIYDVNDSKAGQRAVRSVVDSNWGKEANPWCLIARSPKVFNTYFQAYSIDEVNDIMATESALGNRVEVEDNYTEDNGTEVWDLVVYAPKDGDRMSNAWKMWKNYNKGGYGYEIAFQNGKLLSLRDGGNENFDEDGSEYYDAEEVELTWWDRFDRPTDTLQINLGKKDGLTTRGEIYFNEAQPQGAVELVGYGEGDFMSRKDNYKLYDENKELTEARVYKDGKLSLAVENTPTKMNDGGRAINSKKSKYIDGELISSVTTVKDLKTGKIVTTFTLSHENLNENSYIETITWVGVNGKSPTAPKVTEKNIRLVEEKKIDGETYPRSFQTEYYAEIITDGVSNVIIDRMFELNDIKESLKSNIKFSKSSKKSITAQSAINIATGLDYNNNIKRLDITEKDINENLLSDEITIYHGGSIKSVKDIDGVVYFSEDKLQAKEYAKGNEGNVEQFVIKEEDIVSEDVIYREIDELGLKARNGFEVDELNLYELIDPAFETSLSKSDLAKLFKSLNKKGIKAVRFTDMNLKSLKNDISNIAVFDKKSIKKPKKLSDKEIANFIINKVAEGYNDFYFADDTIKNSSAVKDVLNNFDIKGSVQQAKVKFSKTLNTKFNEMLERKTGIPFSEEIEKMAGRQRGKGKGRFKIFISPSAEDFRGLTQYVFAGKGKQGEADQKFFEEALMDPYFKGVAAIEAANAEMKTELKALYKKFKGIKKKLKNNTENKNFTNDQAVRVYLWTKAGYKIPGISEQEQKTLNNTVNNDATLLRFAESLLLATKRKKWGKPGEYWDSQTLLNDIQTLTEKINRKDYIKEFIQNSELIFSEKNLNKIEASFGPSTRSAIEDSLYAMKTGSNRTVGQNQIDNKWMNWLNSSIGSIMFFNRKSALLQTLSTMNFINWHDNNPAKAALAFANQPQFWKDFVFLFNSPKLKERRGGLKSDIQSAEIANAARGSKNKASAILSYLLKIGFTPTQIADSFAISSGGATFYRNRINTYLKEQVVDKELTKKNKKVTYANKYTKKQAEEKAFLDFSKISDVSQQSGDPALVSQQQRSIAGRFILAFQNYPMQSARIQKKAAQDLLNRRGDPKEHLSKILYYGAIQSVLFNTISNGLFTLFPGFDNEDEEEKIKKNSEKRIAKALKGMVDSAVKGTGIYGAVATTIKNTYKMYVKQEERGSFKADHAYTLLEGLNLSPQIGSKAADFYSAIQTKRFNEKVIEKHPWSITIDGKFNPSPNYDIAGSLSSAILNLPLDRVLVEARGVAEMLDKRNTQMQRLFLALGFRAWDVNATNEEFKLIKDTDSNTKKSTKSGGLKLKNIKIKPLKIK